MENADNALCVKLPLNGMVLMTQSLNPKNEPEKQKKSQPLTDPYSLGVWIRCEMCEDFWCTRHEQHAGDCPCPPIDDWISQDIT